MERKYQSFTEMSQIVLNVLLIIGSLSVFLSILGYANLCAYYRTLGINSQSFLEFGNIEILFNGFIENLPLIFIVLYILLPYFPLFEIRSLKNTANNILSSLPHGYLRERNQLRNAISKAEKIEITLTDTLIKKRYPPYSLVILILVVLNIILITYLANLKRITFALCSIEEQIIIVYTFQLLAKRMITTRKIMSTILAVVPILFIVLLLLSIINGYLEALNMIQTHDFDSYTIETQRGYNFQDAKFIYFGKENYFFNIDNKLNIIPKSEITLLKKNS